MITTSSKFENFIENEDEWFSDIELKVLDLEQELTEWRESRTREFTETPPRRDREMLRARGNARPTQPGPASKPRKPSGRAQRAYRVPRWPAPTTIRETGAIGMIFPYGPVAKYLAFVF